MKNVMLKTMFFSLVLYAAAPSSAFAHCDTMNGPVVKAAQQALEKGDVNLVLIWVQKKDDAEIRKAFEKTLMVRKLGAEAKALADMYFFETLVRVHRAGEGEPYTGLKPASEVEPGIKMADEAVDKGSGAALVKELSEGMHTRIHDLLSQVMAKKNYKKDDTEAGREYVKSYVTYIHYVETLFQSIEQSAAEHAHSNQGTGQHQH